MALKEFPCMLLRVLRVFTLCTLVAAASHWWARLDLGNPASAAQAPAALASDGASPGTLWDATNIAELQEQVDAHKEFAPFLDRVIADLTSGLLDASEAADRVYYYCLAHQSQFLQNVQALEPGATPREKIARMLARAAQEFQAEHALPP